MTPRVPTLTKTHRYSLHLLGFMIMGLVMGLIVLPPGRVGAMAQSLAPETRRGYSLLERGWVNDAIAAFRAALQRYPQSLEATVGLAQAYQQAGQDDDAWTTYQRVLTLDPDNRQALSALGQLGGYRPQWQADGITALSRLLALAPDDTPARTQRALLLGYQGRFVEALNDYDYLLQTTSAPDVLLGAAQIFTYSGDYARGLSEFERYQATGATLPDTAMTAYARALIETGAATTAIPLLTSRLERLQTQDETTAQLRSVLALAYAHTGQSEAALQTLEPLQTQPSAQLHRARALSSIARLAGNRTQYEAAVALYQQVFAQTLMPSPGFITEVADVLSELPTTQPQALQLYQRLLTLQPDDVPVRVKHLILAHQLGQLPPTQLHTQLQQVTSPLPDNAVERRMLALALVRLDSPQPVFRPLYQQLLASEVNVPFLLVRMAQLLVQAGELDQAKQTLATYTAQLDTPDPASVLLLAEIERQEGNLEASAQRYETFLASWNGAAAIRVDALRGLAGIRLAQQQPDVARELYGQILAQSPEDDRAQLGYTRLAYQTGQVDLNDAEAILNRWLTMHPETAPPSELLDLLGALPPDSDRESLYRELRQQQPDHIGLTRRLVQVVARRNPEEAQALVEELMHDQPSSLEPYWIAADLAQSLGHLDQAADAYLAILDQQPDLPEALSALGGLRFQQARYAEAMALFEQVLTLTPQDWETRRVLAELRLVQDQPLSGLRQLQQLQQSPQPPGARGDEVNERLDQTRLDLLQRRGFQPYWERY